MGADAGMAFISRHVCLAYCIKVLFFVIIHIICIYIYIGYIYIYIFMFICIYVLGLGDISKNVYLCIFWLICGMRYISRFLYLD